MYQTFSFIKATYNYFHFVSLHFVANVRNIQIVSNLRIRAHENYYSKSFCHSLHSKRKRKNLDKTNDTSRKILFKKLYPSLSEMSFNASTDGVSSISTDKCPGTSVCFQFWITNCNLNLKGICPTSSNSNNRKRSINEILRKFDIVSPSKELSAMNNDSVVKLKVLNYNVLSQVLLHRHHYLYKKQNSYMLSWEYRKELITKDITAINPDIFCLQEVEEDQLPHFFKHLETLGYKSVNKMKTRNKGDGLAIYYRNSDIQLKDTQSVEFSQPGVIELESRDNVGLIAKFEKGGKQFYVANTHLLYNPKRTEVRLAQLQLLLAELHRITRGNNSKESRILLMGDFNSIPESPVVKFLIDGRLRSHYKPLPPCLGISPETTHLHTTSKLYHSEKRREPSPDDCMSYSIRPGSPNERSYVLTHQMNFKSAYDLTENDDRGVTTFQEKWVMVDYIFYSNGFELTSRLTLPTSSDCYEKVHFIPNKFFPSDHLPLAAEFEIH